MDALTATIISIVSPYLAKGAEEFAKSAGKTAFDGAKAVVGRLSEWWKGDPIAEAAATTFKTDPEHYANLLGMQLDRQLAQDETLAADLRALVNQLGPNVEVIQEMDVAENVTGADIGRLLEGNVRVQQKIKEAKSVTGFKASEVGSK